MTNEEIFQDLKEKTKDVKIKPRNKVSSLNEVCYYLSLSLLTPKALADVDFYNKEEEFRELFEDFNPRGIVGHGQYLAQLHRVLDHFKPMNPSPYKKVTQAIFLTARYLTHYSSFEAFEKEVYLACLDENTTLKYLEDFRLSSGLSGMYFVKTCLFFETIGLLDVPVVSAKAKAYLLPLLGLVDENEKLYKKMCAIAKNNHVSLYEINCRIEALAC